MPSSSAVAARRAIPGLESLVFALVLAWLSVSSIGAARGEDPVLVNVTGPLAAKLGEKVTFEVELVNRSGRPLTGLRVVDYFDRGFHHEASASPIEQRGTIDMAAGTSRRLTLDFLTDEPGRQCHRVEILDQAHTFMGGATECVLVTAPAAAAPTAAPAVPAPAPAIAAPAPVPAAVPTPVPAPVPALVPAPVAAATVAPPQPTPVLPSTTSIPPAAPLPPRPAAVPSLEFDLTGPGELPDGGVGEFYATVRNTGTVPSGPTKLELDWNPALTALQASDGYALGTNSVTWTMPSIGPGQQERRQINLRGQCAPGTPGGQSTRACVSGLLSEGVGGLRLVAESCTSVRSSAPLPRTPREAGLRITLADTADPVLPGGETTVVCTVSNDGTAPTGRIKVVLEIPQEARVVGDPSPSRVAIEGRVLSFDGIGPIPPGGRVRCEASYRLPAGSGGARAVTRATLSGDGLDGRAETDCTTTFLAP